MNKKEMEAFIARGKTKGAKIFQEKSYTPDEFTSGENGSISGHFATFDHDKPDSWGDVIRKGAFLGTIARRKKSGHPFPLCLNHDQNIIIGYVTDIGEDAKGAYFSAKFFPTEKAQEVRNIVKSGVLWQFSFAYDTWDSAMIKLDSGEKVRELRELELYEISIVMVPANPRATVSDIKRSSGNGLKEHLLREIDQIEAREKADLDIKKRRLLRYIGSDTGIDKLKAMEAQALKDIGEAEAKGKTEWKEQRIRALDSIRKEIRRLEKQ